MGTNSGQCRSHGWGLALGLLLTAPAFAWVYPEHRDIAVLGVQVLDPQRAAAFDKLWKEARIGHENRLCEQPAVADQGTAPMCLDWAALPAIAGDHSCSSKEMLDTVLRSDWILNVADVAAQLKQDLSRVPVVPAPGQQADSDGLVKYPDFARRIQGEQIRSERLNALRTSDIRLQRADPAYATRAGANNAHFLLARPTTKTTDVEYAGITIGPGAELNAVGVYSYFHLSALQKALRLANETFSPAQRSNLVRAMLADEAFALHFLQDTFAAGHVSGTWGSTSQRKGTHDFYNANGLEVLTWDHQGGTIVIMGDAHMRPEDAEFAARAVRHSLEQLLDAVNGKPVPGTKHSTTLPLEPDAFDVCNNITFPRRPPGQQFTSELSPVLAQVLAPTPIPALGPGLGSVPRFRSELGTFVGLAGALARLAHRGGRAVGSVEDVDHLRQQRDAGGHRDRFAAQPLRFAAAVPVLVQAVDAVGHRVGESQLARDVGTALAARLDQLLRVLRPVAHDVHDAAQPLREAHRHAGVGEDKAQHLRQAVAHRLEVALEGQVVGQVQLADARGVAAASQVLQQQRVVQLPQLALGQADVPADVHADPAGAHAVAFGLAFGDVERVAQGADQFGQAQGADVDRRGGVRASAKVESIHPRVFGAAAADLGPHACRDRAPRGYKVTVCRTARSHAAMRSCARSRGNAGWKVRSTAHWALS